MLISLHEYCYFSKGLQPPDDNFLSNLGQTLRGRNSAKFMMTA